MAMLDEAERNLVNLMRGESRARKNTMFSAIVGDRRTAIEKVDTNLVIENSAQLEEEIKKIYNGNSNKVLYLGLADENVVANIKAKITDISKNKINQVLHSNVDYAIRIVPSDLQHFKKNSMSVEDVIEYVNRIPDIITDFDNVFMDVRDYKNKKRITTPRLAETNAANNTPEASEGIILFFK